MATCKLQSGNRTGQLTTTGITGRLGSSARRLGEMLLECAKITPYQLQEALHEQRRTNEKLGEILVRFGLLGADELKELLLRQQKDSTGDPNSIHQELSEVLRQASQKKLLGQLLVDFRRITPEQLERALAEQDRSNERLGQVMLRLGLVDKDELDAILMLQSGQLPLPPAQIRCRLGEILVASRKISREQLAQALRQQCFSRQQIGQILLEAGFISAEDLRQALHLQGRMATVALVAIVSVGSLSAGGAAPAKAPARPGTVTVWHHPPLPATGKDSVGAVPAAPRTLPSRSMGTFHSHVMHFSGFAAAANDPVAWITWIERAVKRKAAGQDTWNIARVHDSLAPGDQVQTGRGARAELTYRDGTVIRLAESTTLIQAVNPEWGYRLLQKLWPKASGIVGLGGGPPCLTAGHQT